jgi:hypothetical protein
MTTKIKIITILTTSIFLFLGYLGSRLINNQLKGSYDFNPETIVSRVETGSVTFRANSPYKIEEKIIPISGYNVSSRSYDYEKNDSTVSVTVADNSVFPIDQWDENASIKGAIDEMIANLKKQSSEKNLGAVEVVSQGPVTYKPIGNLNDTYVGYESTFLLGKSNGRALVVQKEQITVVYLVMNIPHAYWEFFRSSIVIEKS